MTDSMKGVKPEDYTEVSGNELTWYRIFQPVPGSSEWYLRLVIDDENYDDIITFGPLDAGGVDRFAHLLAGTYCHVQHDIDGLESRIARDASSRLDEEAEDDA